MARCDADCKNRQPPPPPPSTPFATCMCNGTCIFYVPNCDDFSGLSDRYQRRCYRATSITAYCQNSKQYAEIRLPDCILSSLSLSLSHSLCVFCVYVCVQITPGIFYIFPLRILRPAPKIIKLFKLVINLAAVLDQLITPGHGLDRCR